MIIIASCKYLEEEKSESEHELSVSANQKVVQKLIKEKYLFILIYKLKDVYIFYLILLLNY